MEPVIKKSEQTKMNILAAAEQEFAGFGLHGARIDRIAANADVNKRMIYEHFQSKEKLYQSVLCEVYGRLSVLETIINENEHSPVGYIRALLREYIHFLDTNPAFVKLIMWENLNEGAFLDEQHGKLRQTALDAARQVLTKGIETGDFRRDMDVTQVCLMMNMLCFSQFSNRFTMSKVFGIPTYPVHTDEITAHVTDVILRFILA